MKDALEQVRAHYMSRPMSGNRIQQKGVRGHVHRAAHIVTAAVRATCLQSKAAAPGLVNGVIKLGNDLPAAAAAPPAYLARRAGRYKLNATTEMFVRAPEKS